MKALPHPSCSPDMASSDYHLFLSISHGLAKHNFRSYGEAKNWLVTWVGSKPAEFFRDGFRHWLERWENVETLVEKSDYGFKSVILGHKSVKVDYNSR